MKSSSLKKEYVAGKELGHGHRVDPSVLCGVVPKLRLAKAGLLFLRAALILNGAQQLFQNVRVPLHRVLQPCLPPDVHSNIDKVRLNR